MVAGMSDLAQQIQRAVGAHGMWKTRLKDAIASGRSEFTVEMVTRDDRCDFGRWLHTEADPTMKASPHYQKVRELHAAFHRQAAAVLAHAVAGRQAEARAALDLRSPFAAASAQLTQAMMEWRRTAG